MSKGRELKKQGSDRVCDGMVRDPIMGVELDGGTESGISWPKELIMVELVEKVET